GTSGETPPGTPAEGPAGTPAGTSGETASHSRLPESELLAETLAALHPADPDALAAARAHQDRLTKPRGSLGALEEVAVRLAGAAGVSPPPMPAPAALAIFAADHGVHARGVSPWPQEVTVQMVGNFLAGGAVANAFAAQAGVSVTVVDVGVAADLPAHPRLINRKIAYGTADLSRGPAMTPSQAVQALEAGIGVARDLVASGARCLITGDMGIANTTSSAALIAAFTGRDPAEVTGLGTGISPETHALKIETVRDSLRINDIHPAPGAAQPREESGLQAPAPHRGSEEARRGSDPALVQGRQSPDAESGQN